MLSLHGHLFDSGLINAALDLIEQAGGRFDLLEVNVRPNPTDSGDPYGGDRLSPCTDIWNADTRPQCSRLSQKR